MYRHTQRPRSVARFMGLAVLVVAYAAMVVWAGNLAHADPTTVSGATAVTGATAALSAPIAQASAELGVTDREAPLATLAIALAMVAAGATWYVARALRSRHPLARRARLVVRYITTLV